MPSVTFILGATYGWLAILAAISIAAWWRGTLEVRLASTACVAAWLASLAVESFDDLKRPQLGVLAVDVCLFAALLAIGLRAHRLWPLVAAGFQLMAISLHLAFLLAAHIWSQAYYAGLMICSWLVLASVASGLVPARR